MQHQNVCSFSFAVVRKAFSNTYPDKKCEVKHYNGRQRQFGTQEVSATGNVSGDGWCHEVTGAVPFNMMTGATAGCEHNSCFTATVLW